MTADAAPAPGVPPIVRHRSLVAFLLSFIPPLLYAPLGAGWALLAGIAATGWAAWVLVEGIVSPHLLKGKRWAALALALAGVTTFLALGDVAQEMLWRRAFQLTQDLAVYQDPTAKWSVLYPYQWGRQEQRTSGTTSQVFRPSKMTPAMQFSVTHRPRMGTRDLSLIIEGFFMNLPKGKETEILEREPVVLPSGQSAYRVVYSDLSRRIPLKNEILFILNEEDLYFLSVQATPRWFDRHRLYLERILYSLTLPAS